MNEGHSSAKLRIVLCDPFRVQLIEAYTESSMMVKFVMKRRREGDTERMMLMLTLMKTKKKKTKTVKMTKKKSVKMRMKKG